MGLTSSSQTKITLDEKLQYLQTKILKPCTYHRKQCTLYCAMPNCQKCPYLCPECQRENIHPHQDGIYGHNQFIKAIVTLIQIQVRKGGRERSMMASGLGVGTGTGGGLDYQAIYREQVKLMEQVDTLQREIKSILGEYRSKLQSSMQRLLKKPTTTIPPPPNPYISFYRNPNLLASKLSSEPDDKFLLSLKSQLRAKKTLNPSPNSNTGPGTNSSINEEEYMGQLRSQFVGVKGRIREILAGGGSGFARKNTVAGVTGGAGVTVYPAINPVLKKTFLVGGDCPIKIAIAGNTVNIGTTKQLYNIQASSKQLRKLSNTPILSLTANPKSPDFLSTLSPTKLLLFTNNSLSQLPLLQKISGLALLKSRRRLYALLGQEEGGFNVIDLEQNKSVFYYRCGSEPICFVEVCEMGSVVCCAGRKGVWGFRYRSCYGGGEDTGEYQFQYAMQLSPTIIPQGQLQLLRINNTELYLFGPCRNLTIYDLLLSTTLLQTEYIKKSPPFIQAQFIVHKELEYLITLNQGEDGVNLWLFDKGKRSLRVDQILRDKDREKEKGEKGDRKIVGVAAVKGEIWVLRDGVKNVDVYALE